MTRTSGAIGLGPRRCQRVNTLDPPMIALEDWIIGFMHGPSTLEAFS